MCDFGITAIATMAVGALGSAFSAYQTVTAQNRAASTNAAIARRNADAAEYQAQYETKVGDIQAKQKRLEISQMVGKQRAAAAASGVDVNSGSPLATQIDTQTFGELDINQIKQNAAVKAWSSRNQAADFQAQASLYDSQKTSPLLAVGTSLMSSISPLAGAYVQKKYIG